LGRVLRDKWNYNPHQAYYSIYLLNHLTNSLNFDIKKEESKK
jgi:hypothetical protein